MNTYPKHVDLWLVDRLRLEQNTSDEPDPGLHNNLFTYIYIFYIRFEVYKKCKGEAIPVMFVGL